LATSPCSLGALPLLGHPQSPEVICSPHFSLQLQNKPKYRPTSFVCFGGSENGESSSVGLHLKNKTALSRPTETKPKVKLGTRGPRGYVLRMSQAGMGWGQTASIGGRGCSSQGHPTPILGNVDLGGRGPDRGKLCIHRLQASFLAMGGAQGIGHTTSGR
jgi:hypothetical protein